MKTKLVIGLLSIAFSSNAFAAALFTKGAETFRIQNSKGQTPTFRVLSDSMTKQALAMAAIGMLNAQKEVEPKLPLTSYVDLKFQTLTLTPKGKNLELRLKLSGYTVDLDQTISRDDFTGGKPITVNYPKTTKDVAMYSVTSNGSLKMHLVNEKIIFENVEAHLSIDNPMGETEVENLKFAGTGQRVSTEKL